MLHTLPGELAVIAQSVALQKASDRNLAQNLLYATIEMIIRAGHIVETYSSSERVKGIVIHPIPRDYWPRAVPL